MMRHVILRTPWLAAIMLSLLMASKPASNAATIGVDWYAPSGSSDFCGYLGWLGYNSTTYPWHLAQDMCNAAGNSVYSIGDGEIIQSRTNVGGYGPNFTAGGALIARYQAADGTWFTALYGHLDSPHAAGHVDAGEVIGTSNNFYYTDTAGKKHYCPHVHFAIHPGYDQDSVASNWWRGYTSDTRDTYGYTNPVPFLDAHSRLPQCTPASISWTSLPRNDVWYRSNERLAYSWGGTSPGVDEGPRAGNLGEIYMAEAGSGHIRYWASANNGCNGQGTQAIEWWGYFDNQPPVLGWNGDSAPSGTWLRGTQYAKWHWSDAHSNVRSGWYAWNGGVQSDGGSGVAQLPEGKNTLQVYVEDNAWNGGVQSGNSSTISAEFWLDNAEPSANVPVINGPTCTSASSISISASGTDVLSGVAKLYVLVNGQQVSTIVGSSGVFSWDTSGLPDGAYTVAAKAVDAAGNQSPVSGPVTITLDKTKPVITESTPQSVCAGGWYNSPVSIDFTADDGTGCGVASKSALLDGQPASLPVDVTAEGEHTVELQALDNAGNLAVKTLQVNVDLSQPAVSDILPAASVDTASASWVQTDNGSGVFDAIWWIGTTSGGQEVVPPSHIGPVAHFWRTNLSLDPGAQLYLSVKAIDRACNESQVQTIVLPPLSTGNDKPFVMASGGVSTEARTSDNYRVVDTLGEPIAGDYTVEGLTGIMAGMWLPDGFVVPDVPLGEAVKLPDGTLFKTRNPVVVTAGTADFTGCFYVEEEGRSSGIRVEVNPLAPIAVTRGRKVIITGRIATTNGEKVIRYPSIVDAGNGDIRPLYLSNQVIAQLPGLSPAGLLVTTTGTPLPVSETAIYVVDEQGTYGVSYQGVWVMLEGLKQPFAFPLMSNVKVTGICSYTNVDGHWVRCIRPRDINDITTSF